jgi:hypothetical protein
MDDNPDQARRWRERAEEMRSVAETMNDRSARTNLLAAAATWETMAQRAETRSQATMPTPVPGQRLRRKSTIVTCRCGARYQRKMVQEGPRVRDSFDCVLCKKPIEIWRSPLSPSFKLIVPSEAVGGNED